MSSWSGKSETRKPRNCPPSGADRASAAQHASHQRRARNDEPADRSRGRAVSGGVFTEWRRRAAAGAATVSGVRGAAGAVGLDRAGGRGRRACERPVAVGQGCPKCEGLGQGPGRDSRDARNQQRGARVDLPRASEHDIRKAGRRPVCARCSRMASRKPRRASRRSKRCCEWCRWTSCPSPLSRRCRRSSRSRPGRRDLVAGRRCGSSSGPPATERRRRRVLVVEDSRTIASVVKYFLELEGFEVRLAANGRIGLELALSERPDFIVSDVNMPDMGGVEMVKALRADPRMARYRILMLTSESGVDCEAEGLEAGADDYILKPVEPRRLAARVKALLARSRGRTGGAVLTSPARTSGAKPGSWKRSSRSSSSRAGRTWTNWSAIWSRSRRIRRRKRRSPASFARSTGSRAPPGSWASRSWGRSRTAARACSVFFVMVRW